jgi:hypothetical protein
MRSSGRFRYRSLGFLFLGLGAVAFVVSIIFGTPAILAPSFAAFLIGVLLAYLSFMPTVPTELVGGALMPMMNNLEALFKNLQVNEYATYVGPRDGNELTSYRVFIPLSSDANDMLPKSKVTDEILITSYENSGVNGLLLDPPGSDLLRMLERESGQDIGSVELSRLQEALNNGIVKSLDLASSLRLTFEDSKAHLVLEGDALWEFTKELAENAPIICERVGCPICSLVACALTKSSHRAVRFQGAKHLDRKHTSSYELIE